MAARGKTRAKAHKPARKRAHPKAAARPTAEPVENDNVIDLVEALKKSLGRKSASSAKARKRAH